MAKKKRAKLKKDDLRTFWRLLAFARPYMGRLAIGAICSALGGGSIVAMFFAGQSLFGFIFDNRALLDHAEPPAIEMTTTISEAGMAEKAEFVPVVANETGEDAPELVESATSEDAAPVMSGFVGKFASKMLPESELRRLESYNLPTLLSICGILMLLILLNSLAYFASMYLLQWVGQRVVMDLRIRLFAHLQKLSMSFYNTSSSGDMISRAVSDTQVLQHTVTSVVTDAVRQPIVLVLVLAYIIVIEWELAVFSLVLFPVVIVPIILIGRRLRNISREGQKRLADLTSVMKESLDGVMVVKAFGQEAREEARFTVQCRGFFRQMVRATQAKALSDPITHTIGGLGGVGVLLYAMLARMPIEECVVFACAIWALYEPVKKLGRISMEIQQGSAAADRIFEILDTPVSVGDLPGAVPISDPLRSIVFKDVAFSYGDRNVFDALNLEIKEGSSLAVVGPSGGGKTTLVGLLLRFFDPDSGAVLRNGVDIQRYTLDSLRGNIGLVMQDTFLFNASIAENIAYGCPDASRERIEQVANLANAHAFIIEKEHGYDTIVGERGVSLSGGQKQRIAIARALLRDPAVLILDEATSALDTESERNVQAAIDALMGRMTMIVIAHRLSTIAKCDHVAVIADGGVAEYGTHIELLAKGGIYTRLHEMQFS